MPARAAGDADAALVVERHRVGVVHVREGRQDGLAQLALQAGDLRPQGPARPALVDSARVADVEWRVGAELIDQDHGGSSPPHGRG